MIILVINSGSSSVKYQIFDMEDDTVLCRGIVEKIGTNFSRLKLTTKKISNHQESGVFLDHYAAMSRILEIIVQPEFDIIEDLKEISAVGHRVVHGGEYFNKAKRITSEVVTLMERCSELAPLHNPPNILGMKICQEMLPSVPQIVVFDTSFHLTMKPHVFLYGLPFSIYEKYKIRRYGFHGTSHFYAAHVAAKFIEKPIEELKIITCHLGNGASIAAIENGKSVDTSMGFTPLEGLMMGSRCGDLDPAIIPYLMEKDDLTINGITNLMNKHSGVLGIAEMETSDMYNLELAANSGNKKAILARKMFSYRVKKYIGAYAAVLGGIDILVFTGGIGENDAYVRQESTSGLEFLGIKLDDKLNVNGQQQLISNGNIPVIIVTSDEERVIANESLKILEN